MTMMVVTHEMGFARRVAHRVVVHGTLAARRRGSESRGVLRRAPLERAKDFLSKILSH
jgi:glutamate/aspartate transport system ATP-binding protein